MTTPLQASLIGIATAPADCVNDPLKDQIVHEVTRQAAGTPWLEDDHVVPLFLARYKNWINSTELNKVSGLDTFPSVAFAHGTTESFDKFYIRNHKRRFRCHRGEYLYHELSWKAVGYNWAYIDDEPLAEGDAVVCSFPFADTGAQKHTKEFLDKCAELKIPVLFDCAFFGICAGHDFNFDHPAITDVCFSLSKPFPVYGMRIGIRFSKDTTDGLNIYGDTHYVNKFGAAVGARLFEHQHPDEIFNAYREQQLTWCREYDLEPSMCVTFGIDHKHKYDNHNRGSKDTNRVCFAKFFNKGYVPL